MENAHTPALVKGANAEQEYADFFNSFFADGGGYMKYVSTSGDGRVKTIRCYYGKQKRIQDWCKC